MKEKNITMVCIFLIGIINIFSFIQTPYISIFYSLKLISFVAVTLLLLITGLKSKNKIDSPNFIVTFTMLIWLFMLMPSMFIINGSELNGFSLFISYALLGIFSFLLIPININRFDLYLKLSKVWISVLGFSILISVVLSLIGFTEKYYIDPSTSRIRYVFSFINPNSLGLFCYIILIIILTRYLINKTDLKSMFKYIIMLIPFMYILILSDSRTAMYSLFVWVGVYTLLFISRNQTFNIITFTSVIVIVLIILGNTNVDTDNLDVLLSNRISNWMTLINSLQGTELFFGNGIGILAADLGVITFDNSYISFFIKSGLFGIVGMCIFIIVLFVQISKINNYKLKSIAFATFSSWLVYCLFESAFFSLGNLASVIIWCELGLLISSNNFIKK
ncbi:O-antigen ligase family protein [Sporosarcina siberiensis]|uniref:O-antigen ligase family protein n=1 Tax=Sporosarcina siberiensis TaxID=1365606 RepID=A0ABW4SE23_9BACL